MRSLLVGAALLICVPAQAQEPTGSESLIERLNEAVGDAQSAGPAEQGPVIPLPTEPEDRAQPAPMVGPAELGSLRAPAHTNLPNWGVVVRDQSGDIVDVFGQIEYEVTSDGMVKVPGYTPPPGTSLEVVPTVALSVASEDLDSRFQPLSAIPGAVQVATEFLAQELCAKMGRPTGITLSLVVTASGSIGIVSGSTQAGSSVNWDFQDVCGRYGLEGEGIAFE